VRALIADDDPVARLLLRKTLERSGYEVISVGDGRLAAEQLSQSDGPRIALLDWVMPELDGPGVCRAIRSQPERGYVYLVLLTSRESKEDIVVGLESGADDYLTKPFNERELMARLRAGERILRLEGELVRAREHMRFKATHDALTMVWNRGVIMDLLSRELSRSQREHGSTVLLLADLDHFKSVNDKYGHLVGDEVLKEVSRRLLGSIRAYDFVGRYGGEEFLIVLNNCNSNSAMARAEEIRTAIGKPHPDTSGSVVPYDEHRSPVKPRVGPASHAGTSAGSGLGSLCCQGGRPELYTAGGSRFGEGDSSYARAERNDGKRSGQADLVFRAGCANMSRMAALDPGARRSRQDSKRLQMVSIFSNR
jgi:two-component system, cell cycle response regulator